MSKLSEEEKQVEREFGPGERIRRFGDPAIINRKEYRMFPVTETIADKEAKKKSIFSQPDDINNEFIL